MPIKSILAQQNNEAINTTNKTPTSLVRPIGILILNLTNMKWYFVAYLPVRTMVLTLAHGIEAWLIQDDIHGHVVVVMETTHRGRKEGLWTTSYNPGQAMDQPTHATNRHQRIHHYGIVYHICALASCAWELVRNMKVVLYYVVASFWIFLIYIRKIQKEAI